MADIQLPQLGESVTEGTITRWFKNVGDSIAEDEVLFEVSTDKVDSEVPSPVSGVLTEIRVPEGETVDVGTVLAVVGDAGSAPAPAAAPAAAPEPEPAPTPEPPPAPVAKAAPASAPAPVAPAAPPVAATAPAPAPAAPAAVAAPAAAPAAAGDSRVTSPIVRRLIADYGLNPASITGTGAGGRITRSDVEAAIRAGLAGGGPRPAAAPAPAASTATAAPSTGGARRSAPAPRSGTGDTVEPLSNIRRRTGEHMIMSKTTAPHAYTIVEIDYENVERTRRRHREQFRADEGFSLTYLPFQSRAIIDALRDFPHLNASMGNGELIVHNYVNLAIAVDLDFEGLLAPVVQEADDKRLRAIARDINDLATRARTKQLSADEISGGTFTISNSGSFGSHLVLPIINQPQVAIVSTDGVSRKPVVVTGADGGESIAVHSVGLMAMSWDHRAFDGAYAAAFLRHVKEIIETRDWEAEI